jgi:hypothetical protein
MFILSTLKAVPTISWEDTEANTNSNRGMILPSHIQNMCIWEGSGVQFPVRPTNIFFSLSFLFPFGLGETVRWIFVAGRVFDLV